ncbi:MAG TPA: winged helix-turn-helix domain-containing protein [Candidatus Paceibacterota bacterium]
MKFGKTEDWLNRKIDITRVKLEVAKPPVPEITDPIEIQKKLNHARVIFSNFLHSRTGKRSSSDVGFTMSFDNMAATLELTNLSTIIRQAEMDAIVLSVPSMAKTETGYIVSNPDSFYENFGRGATRKKILQILSSNPDKTYSYEEIAKELSLSRAAIYNITKKLITEGKVVKVKEVKYFDREKGTIPGQFTIAK